MKKIFFVMSALCISLLTFAQNNSNGDAVKEAIAFLKNNNYIITQDGNHIEASHNGESYTIFINETAQVPILRVETELKSYGCPSHTPLASYEFANVLNQQLPFLKFDVGITYAGDYALVAEDLEEYDIIQTTLSASMTTFYGTIKQLVFILEDCLNSLKDIKANMPPSLE